VRRDTHQQRDFELKKRIREILRCFRCREQDAAGDHDHEAKLLPWSERANHVGSRNVGQCPTQEPQVGDQDQPAEYRDAREMGRQQDRIHESRFTHGGEHGDVLNALADRRETHVIR